MSNLAELSKLTEDEARDYLERIRWPNGPVCPHCGVVDEATKLEGKAHRAGVYKCRSCRRQFTVTVGTIFERSHIELRLWIMAFAIMCASKKGVSAKQLQRQLGLGSYQSAWHMAHRVRHAMSTEPLKGMLAGQVEVDEAYVGGKPRLGNNEPRKTGRGTKKAAVMALVQRGGSVRAFPIERVNARTLKQAIRQNVDRSAMVLTDEWAAYQGLGKEFKGGHFTVNHGAGEYWRGGAGTNTTVSANWPSTTWPNASAPISGWSPIWSISMPGLAKARRPWAFGALLFQKAHFPGHSANSAPVRSKLAFAYIKTIFAVWHPAK